MSEGKCPDCGAELTARYSDTGEWLSGVEFHHPGGITCLQNQLAQEREKNERLEAVLLCAIGQVAFDHGDDAVMVKEWREAAQPHLSPEASAKGEGAKP